MKKLCEKLKSCVMQCSHAARSCWRKWPKRKRIAVCGILVLFMGAVIFCTKVSPFYWLPNEISIPNGSNMKAYFVDIQDRSHPEVQSRQRQLFYRSAINYLEYERFGEMSSPYIFALVRVEHMRGINTYNPYQMEGAEIRRSNSKTPVTLVEGWIGDAILEVTIEEVMIDLHAQPLEVGQKVLIYKDGREGYEPEIGKPNPSEQPMIGETYWVQMQCTADMFYNTKEAHYEPFYSYLADYHVDDSGLAFFKFEKENLNEETFYNEMKNIGIESWQLYYALEEWKGKEFECGR